MSKVYICKECNGKGEVVFIWGQMIYKNKPLGMITCARCGGLGWLDWVENVVAKSKSICQTIRWMEEKEIRSKWREVSPGRWEEIAENNRGKGIGLSSKGESLSYGEERSENPFC